eukprot:3302716-Amphidinium_carterae.1
MASNIFAVEGVWQSCLPKSRRTQGCVSHVRAARIVCIRLNLMSLQYALLCEQLEGPNYVICGVFCILILWKQSTPAIGHQRGSTFIKSNLPGSFAGAVRASKLLQPCQVPNCLVQHYGQVNHTRCPRKLAHVPRRNSLRAKCWTGERQESSLFRLQVFVWTSDISTCTDKVRITLHVDMLQYDQRVKDLIDMSASCPSIDGAVQLGYTSTYIVECHHKHAHLASSIGQHPKSWLLYALCHTHKHKHQNLNLRDMRSNPTMQAKETQLRVWIGMCALSPHAYAASPFQHRSSSIQVTIAVDTAADAECSRHISPH